MSTTRKSALLRAATLVALAGCSGESASDRPPAANPSATPAVAAAPAPATAGSVAAAPAATPATDAVATQDGRAVFNRTCVTCHQQNGQGLRGAFPPLAASPFVNGDKARLIKLVLHGLQGPITVSGQRFNNVMPPWKSLSDAELAAVLTYVRSNFGNTAPAVTAAEVAQQRAATASRATMWTVPEIERP